MINMIHNTGEENELNRQTVNMLFPSKDYVPIQISFTTGEIDNPGSKYFRLPKAKVAYSMGNNQKFIGDLSLIELQEYVDQCMEDTPYEGNLLEVKFEEPPNFQNYDHVKF